MDSGVASRLQKAYELNKRQGRPRAVVVGAGVVGLSQVCLFFEYNLLRLTEFLEINAGYRASRGRL